MIKKELLARVSLSVLLCSAVSGHAVGSQHEEHAHEQHEEYADEHAHEQHESHVHGEAELLVAVDDHVMEIEFHSPAMNLTGFEHRPQTPQEIEELAAAGKKLNQAEILFILPTEAGCKVQQVNVDIPFQDQSSMDHSGHEDEAHSDFSAHYQFECQSPAQLTSFTVNLFTHFPRIETIHGKSVSGHGQNAFELSHSKGTVEL